MSAALYDAIGELAEAWFASSDLDSHREHIAAVVFYMLNSQHKHDYYRKPVELLIMLLQRAYCCRDEPDLGQQYKLFVSEVLHGYLGIEVDAIVCVKREERI